MSVKIKVWGSSSLLLQHCISDMIWMIPRKLSKPCSSERILKFRWQPVFNFIRREEKQIHSSGLLVARGGLAVWGDKREMLLTEMLLVQLASGVDQCKVPFFGSNEVNHRTDFIGFPACVDWGQLVHKPVRSQWNRPKLPHSGESLLRHTGDLIS